MPVHRNTHILARALGLFLACLAFEAAAYEVGQPLRVALAELERSGLRLIYSSALVTDELTVQSLPRANTPEEAARELLAPHGLALEQVAPSQYAIVRAANAAVVDGDSAASKANPPPVDLLEVEVHASRWRIAAQDASEPVELTRAHIEALPGLDQDALRVARYLPGLTTSGFSSRPFVRGGRQNETAYFFDGVPLYEPFHFKDFQGLLGIFDPSVVSRIDVYSGVLPVRFGDRLSGVIDIVPRRVEPAGYHALGLSPIFASGLTSGRMAKREIEWLAAARVSTIEAVLDQLDDSIGRPDFLDVVARVSMPLGERAKVSAGWLMLDDRLRVDLADSSEVAQARYRDTNTWVRAEFALDDAMQLSLVGARAERHTNRRGSIARASAQGSVDDARTTNSTLLRAVLEREQRTFSWSAGLEWTAHDAKFFYRGAGSFDRAFASAFARAPSYTRTYDLESDGSAAAAFAAGTWRLADRWTLSLAGRFDRQDYEPGFQDSQFSPRLALEYQYDAATTVRVSAGRMHQTERPDELQVADGEPVFHETQRATQVVVSVDRAWSDSLTSRLEVFRKSIADPLPVYENILDSLVVLPELEVDRVRIAPLAARAYGAELSGRWEPSQRWSSWFSYAWSETTDEFDGFSAPRSWDQRHSVTAGVAWTRAPWQLSSNLRWHSGWRSTELALDQASPGGPTLVLAPRNSSRYAEQFSLDLRVTWSRPLPRGNLKLYGEINNATNRENACCTSYDLEQIGSVTQLTRDVESSLPRYGMVGVLWELP
jgi:outer membrane receptor protein involved in Fe transport